MDSLSQALQTLRLQVVASHQLETSVPWAAYVNPKEDDSPHVLFRVLEGDLWFETDSHGGPPVHFAPGDVGLAIVRQSMVARCAWDTEPRPSSYYPRPADNGITRLGDGHEGRLTVLQIVSFRLDAGVAAPLVDAMRPALHLSSGEERGCSLCSMFRLLYGELFAQRPGSQAVAERLLEVLLLETIREQLLRPDGPLATWKEALVDPPIVLAISLIHREPGSPWTVDSLAERVGLARTSFALRFTHCVGESPFRYLTRRRIEFASRLLRTTRLPLHEIARRAGYAEAAAFHKTFTRWTGLRPGELRTATPRFASRARLST